MIDPATFKPGIYEHYKGEKYIALFLGRHHESNELFVAYVCFGHNTISFREWDSPGKDSWNDLFLQDVTERTVQRFRYLGPAI